MFRNFFTVTADCIYFYRTLHRGNQLMDEVNKKHFSFLGRFRCSRTVSSGRCWIYHSDGGTDQCKDGCIFNRSGAVILAGINGGIRQGDPGYYAVQEVQRGVDMGNVVQNRSGGACHRRHLFHSVNQNRGKVLTEVSPYNWGESKVLKDEYKR